MEIVLEKLWNGYEKWTISGRHVIECLNVKCSGWEFMKEEEELV
jgi:hypothetical protein